MSAKWINNVKMGGYDLGRSYLATTALGPCIGCLIVKPPIDNVDEDGDDYEDDGEDADLFF
ncbi:hypothetical protein I4U23_023754 [Adineta vaga]|nr:hypothetical protein I4U23_023754 [Adineta vaga]